MRLGGGRLSVKVMRQIVCPPGLTIRLVLEMGWLASPWMPSCGCRRAGACVSQFTDLPASSRYAWVCHHLPLETIETFHDSRYRTGLFVQAYR